MENEEQIPGNVHIDWTEEKTEAVKKILMDFFNEYELYCGEVLSQDDNGTIYSSVAMSDIADVLFKDIKINWE